MGEPQRAMYPSMIDFHLGYHQAWAREQGNHRSIPGYNHEFLVMPSGLTNALVTFQPFMQWWRHLLLLFDALIVYRRTGEDYWSQWDKIGGIVVVIEFIHLDSVINVLSSQDEIQTYLDRFTENAAGGVVDGIICHRDCTSGIWLIWTPMVIVGAQQQSTSIGSGGLTMWRWDPGIHPSD
jgi:hypothetical protein